MKSNIQQIKKLVESTPNDAVLGEKVRNLFSKDEEFVEDNNIFGKITGEKYKELIEGYQNIKGKDFAPWYAKLSKEEKIWLSSMFD
tara:strand:- start:1169 stop:1426 length:258 start_codon:yes stop_codon:yes gene_type:complete